MNTQLQTFNFNSHALRVITDNDGAPWFIAKDVADHLGYSDTQAMTRKIDEDDVKKANLLHVGLHNNQTLISESGLYLAVLSSSKPETKAFKKWVTAEVLPSIRKTGGYSLAIPKTYAAALRQLADETEAKETALALVASQKETIQHKDDLIRVSNEASVKAGEILIREFVKSQDLITLGEIQFFAWMRGQKIIFSDRNEPYQHYVKAGYFTYKPSEQKHGGEFRYTMRVTPRGKVWLAAKYMAYLDAASVTALDGEPQPRNGLVLLQGAQA